MKFILVTGGVMSGVGKGIVTSSLGALLKASNIALTVIKIDPYLNEDAGLISPEEHGEVFVLNDGSEVDLDLGNYERYLNIQMTGRNSITTGKVTRSIARSERAGAYLGKTVCMVNDVTDFIADWILKTAIDSKAEVCLVELGGTIGDVEATMFQETFCGLIDHKIIIVQVNPVGKAPSGDELKTKPVQNAIRESRRCGLQPHIYMCRTKSGMDDRTREKIAKFGRVSRERVVDIKNVSTPYKVPIILRDSGILHEIGKIFGIPLNLDIDHFKKWERIAELADSANRHVRIALVGKYTHNTDAYLSVVKALEHACYSIETKPDIQLINSGDLEKGRNNPAWEKLKSCSCLIVPGGFKQRDTEGMIDSIKWARENKIPFLGICLGFQMAVIEYSRNILGIPDASSEEFNQDPNSVIIEMLEYQDPERKLGGTMRLGLREVIFNSPSILRNLYGSDRINERHRHRFEVNPHYVECLQREDMKFVAQNQDGSRMEILELSEQVHPYFVAVQFHPEFLSRPFSPSPAFIGLITSACK